MLTFPPDLCIEQGEGSRAGGRSKFQPRQEEGCQAGGGSGKVICPLPREARKLFKYMCHVFLIVRSTYV